MAELALEQNYLVFPQHMPLLSFPAFAAKATYFDSQNIEDIIEVEMARIKEMWSWAEQQYVEQSVLENPITFERRPNNNQHQSKEEQTISDSEEIDVVSVTTETKSDSKQQRADACRRSRHNNKIKKAKSRYRHKYMSLKLQSSTQLLHHLLDVIDQAENHLLSRGFTRDTFQHLRKGFKVDAALRIIQSLDYTMEM